MREVVRAWVALGANLGEAALSVRQAIADLQALAGVDQLLASRLYRTAPQQALGPDFVNAVVVFQTRMSAPALLDALQGLEQLAGRQRPYPNAPRTLDLDLLFYGDARIESTRLTVPHPRWSERAFVLRPLADVSPERVSAPMLAQVSDQAVLLME
ncbi:MAG: 2-amino-4-hydroxy-6-hydroxymethyldihydropteridine diphosphokinase [Pseudomonadota bacterium]|jgi:2-amino-4-hydroxy-6-hydroxymethyldihydropteridine diphosphokinase